MAAISDNAFLFIIIVFLFSISTHSAANAIARMVICLFS